MTPARNGCSSAMCSWTADSLPSLKSHHGQYFMTVSGIASPFWQLTWLTLGFDAPRAPAEHVIKCIGCDLVRAPVDMTIQIYRGRYRFVAELRLDHRQRHPRLDQPRRAGVPQIMHPRDFAQTTLA